MVSEGDSSLPSLLTISDGSVKTRGARETCGGQDLGLLEDPSDPRCPSFPGLLLTPPRPPTQLPALRGHRPHGAWPWGPRVRALPGHPGQQLKHGVQHVAVTLLQLKQPERGKREAGRVTYRTRSPAHPLHQGVGGQGRPGASRPPERLLSPRVASWALGLGDWYPGKGGGGARTLGAGWAGPLREGVQGKTRMAVNGLAAGFSRGKRGFRGHKETS